MSDCGTSTIDMRINLTSSRNSSIPGLVHRTEENSGPTAKVTESDCPSGEEGGKGGGGGRVPGGGGEGFEE